MSVVQAHHHLQPYDHQTQQYPDLDPENNVAVDNENKDQQRLAHINDAFARILGQINVQKNKQAHLEESGKEVAVEQHQTVQQEDNQNDAIKQSQQMEQFCIEVAYEELPNSINRDMFQVSIKSRPAKKSSKKEIAFKSTKKSLFSIQESQEDEQTSECITVPSRKRKIMQKNSQTQNSEEQWDKEAKPVSKQNSQEEEYWFDDDQQKAKEKHKIKQLYYEQLPNREQTKVRGKKSTKMIITESKSKIKKQGKRQIKSKDAFQQIFIQIQVKEDGVIRQFLSNLWKAKKLCKKQTKQAQPKQTIKNWLLNKKGRDCDRTGNLTQTYITIQIQQDKSIANYHKLKKNNNDKKHQLKEVSQSNQSENNLVYQNAVEIGRPAGQPLDTGKATLLELVNELAVHQLISEKSYLEFKQAHSVTDIQEYLLKFRSGTLHSFPYDRIKFTPLDHRRIAQLLAKLYPEEYISTHPFSFDPQLNTFLKKLYQLQAEHYYNLTVRIDRISKIKWWSKILITQDQNLVDVNKKKRLAQRRAELAAAAIDQVIEFAQTANKQSHKRSISQVYEIDLQDQQQLNSKAAKQKQSKLKQYQKQIQMRKQKQDMIKIRNMVSSFGKENNQKTTDQPARKKIKFY